MIQVSKGQVKNDYFKLIFVCCCFDFVFFLRNIIICIMIASGWQKFYNEIELYFQLEGKFRQLEIGNASMIILSLLVF